MEVLRNGYSVGTGAAIDVELGWIPERVDWVNLTDSDKKGTWFRCRHLVFTSGGTNEIKPGYVIVGATSGARATVRQVLLTSGTWAAGDAAGTILFNVDDKTGTFTTEAVYYVGSSTLNDASVVVDVEVGIDVDTEVAAATTTSNVSAFVGSSTQAMGFTFGSVISEDNKSIGWTAFRNADRNG